MPLSTGGFGRFTLDTDVAFSCILPSYAALSNFARFADDPIDISARPEMHLTATLDLPLASIGAAGPQQTLNFFWCPCSQRRDVPVKRENKRQDRDQP